MKKIIISRTDNLGDVVLTFPVCGVIKSFFPSSEIFFLGKGYTRPLVNQCTHVDGFLDWDEILAIENVNDRLDIFRSIHADAIIHVFPVREICQLAQKAGIPLRIATARRWFTITTCNRLLNIPRKHSPLHEAQLNLKLLKPLGIRSVFSLEEIPQFYGLSRETEPVAHQEACNLILHPRSKGSAREWGLENFGRLIEMLPHDLYRIHITGTAEEGQSMRSFLDQYRDRVTDLTGQLSLGELIGLIRKCDVLVAASTGPLHIAAALGKKAIGLFAPIRPMHPGRWAPLGKNARYLVLDKKCTDCRKSLDCHCIRSITPEDVYRLLAL